MLVVWLIFSSLIHAPLWSEMSDECLTSNRKLTKTQQQINEWTCIGNCRVAFATGNWNDVIENNFTMSSLWLEDTLADCWTKTSIWQLLKEICLVTSKQLGNRKFFEKKIKLSANYDIFQMSALSRLMSNLKKLMCEVVNQFDSFAFSKQLGKFIALPATRKV